MCKILGNRILPHTFIAPCVEDGVGAGCKVVCVCGEGGVGGGKGGEGGRAIRDLPCPSDILSICHSVTT